VSPSHTRIKLCGMTRAEDVRLAVALGVDYIGLVFAPRSPRMLGLAQAGALRALVPAGVGVVALVMDAPRAEVDMIASALRPDCLQFHGSEEDGFCASFGLPYFKAIAMGDGADPQLAMARFPGAHGFVLDGHGAGEAGGSGQRFDWTRMPREASRPILLAGGLSAQNVALALRTAQPWGVDVSSGIEQAPGLKDAAKMRAFVAAVRAHDGAS
jgi:phosphoribosylanthranilate isomerase